MKLKFVLAPLRYAVVATLFAICGDWSAQFFGDQASQVHRFSVPFALLSALLFLRKRMVIVALPLMVAVWHVAYMAAIALGFELGSEDYLFPPLVGGLIGGLGLVLCAATCHRRLIAPYYLFGGSVIGVVSALPFGVWLRYHYLHLNDPHNPLQLLYIRRACAIWQAAVGTYLYAICTRPQGHGPGDNSRGEPSS